jgi:acyl-CoA reductase-like NAD-dependent aldehyde dehydrogenase
MARLFTREQGRPVAQAMQEIQGAAGWLRAVAAMRPPTHVAEDTAQRFVETRYVPLGVVCAIAPWNFPISLAVWKIAPCAAGRQHHGAEAVAVHAAVHAQDGRAVP